MITHLINGQQVDGGSRSADVFNPASGKVGGQVRLADRATVESAIAAAQAAYPAWRNTPPLKRARVMSRLKELLEQHGLGPCGRPSVCLCSSRGCSSGEEVHCTQLLNHLVRRLLGGQFDGGQSQLR